MAVLESHLSEKTCIDMYQWLREVCSQKLIQTQITLGGPGIVVQIDESLFRHKPKVCLKFTLVFINLYDLYSITVVEHLKMKSGYLAW